MLLVLALCLTLIGFCLGVFLTPFLFLVLVVAAGAFAAHLYNAAQERGPQPERPAPGRHVV